MYDFLGLWLMIIFRGSYLLYRAKKLIENTHFHNRLVTYPVRVADHSCVWLVGVVMVKGGGACCLGRIQRGGSDLWTIFFNYVHKPFLPTRLFKTTDKSHKNIIKLKAVCKKKPRNRDTATAKRSTLKQTVDDTVVNFVSDMRNKYVKIRHKNTLKDQAK